jgi:GntR family transcriptional regulator
LAFAYVRSIINRDFTAVGKLLQRHTGPILPLIEDLFGQSIVEVHQEIAATLISPALAGGLKVKAATAALEFRRCTPPDVRLAHEDRKPKTSH